MSQSDNQPQEIKKDAAIRSRSLEELFESESTVVRTNPEVSLTTEKGLDFGSGPISIKDMIARLGGIFPIDEAVREGRSYQTLLQYFFELCLTVYSSSRRILFHICQSLWQERMDNHWPACSS